MKKEEAMNKLLSFVLMFLMTFFLWNCSSNRYVKNSNNNLKTPGTENVSNPQPSSATLKYPKVNVLQENLSLSELKKQFSQIASDINFKFNSYKIQPINEYGINENPQDILNKIVIFLKKHPSVKLRIEGNCDERGTIEYNLALGEKRAMAAKNYLVSKGISPDRISIISYGKSRPLDPAHNEYAWAKNRRDHFVIIK